MLQEGYSPALIENLGRQLGMPKGPLEWADDLGLDMVMRYEEQAAAHYGPKYIQHPAVKVLTKMIKELDRSGAKKKKGFYDYQEEVIIWPELTECFSCQVDLNVNLQSLKERFLFAQVIEAIWCLQEKVIISYAAANLGSIYGWGFPAFKGGVIQYINDYGVEQFLERCDVLKEKFGQRFQAPKILEKVASKAVWS